MDNSYYLALDQGGHSSRAMIIDRHGQIVSEHREAIQAVRCAEDRVEYDAETVIRSLRQSINAISQVITPDIPIKAAGLATQRSNVVCWDRITGEALSTVISWQDRRAQSRLARLDTAAQFIHQHTGLHLSPYYGASKLNWCLTELAAVKKAQQDLALGPMASFIAQRLLNEKPFIVDAANASRTLLWDLESRDWSDELLNLFAVPRIALPHCMTTCGSFGTLPFDQRQLPMTVITGDQSAAALAWGLPRTNAAYITVGTGAFIQCFTGRQAVLSEQLLTTLVNLDQDGPLFCLEGTVNGAASALSWACEQFGLEHVENDLDDWLCEYQQPPLFLNGVSGLGTPYLGQTVQSRYIGDGNQQECIVAVIESIVFLLQRNLEILLEEAGPIDKIFLGGGLSRLTGFCQRLADLTQRPVCKSSHHETTSIGMAYLLAGKPADWPPARVYQLFSPTQHATIRQRYNKWRQELEHCIT